MSGDNILYHPAFGNPPVLNPKRRGPKKGTVSINKARRKREGKKVAAEQERPQVVDAKPTNDIVQALEEELKPHIEELVFALGRFSGAYLALKRRLTD